jgi:hypothetical protein
MPNLSASEYTQYLKFKAAATAYTSGIPPRKIQTVDQVSPNINIINSIVKTSQAAYTVAPQETVLTGLNYVRAPPPNNVNNPNALSTLGYAGTSGALSSSRLQQTGGLPTGFKSSQGTYTRLPQNAGWQPGGVQTA